MWINTRTQDNLNPLEFPKYLEIEVGLEEVASHTATDPQSKTMFVADDMRVKSFALTPASEPKNRMFGLPLLTCSEAGLPMHTLHSSGFTGPLCILHGRIIRAGKSAAAVWSLGTLGTYGPKGISALGGENVFAPGDTTLVTSKPPRATLSTESLSLIIKNFSHRWHVHPSIPGSTICGSDPIKTKRYSCFALGLETGKTSGSYLGLTWVMAVKLLDFHPVMPTSMYWSLPAVMVMMRGYTTLEATFPSPPPMSGCEPHLALQQFCATPMESPLYLLADAKPTPTSQWCRSKYGDAYPHSGRSGR